MRLIVLIDEDEMDKMPENCENCILWELFKNGWEYCVGMGHQRIFDDGKPDWCPLRPLPKRCKELDILKAPTVASYAQGWNECLDEITGGKQ